MTGFSRNKKECMMKQQKFAAQLIGILFFLTGCSGMPKSPDAVAYEKYKSNLSFDQTIDRFRIHLGIDKTMLSVMTRTFGCIEDLNFKKKAAWSFICSTTPPLFMKDPTKPKSISKRVIISEAQGEVLILMTSPPNLMFGGYIPSNFEILRAVGIDALPH